MPIGPQPKRARGTIEHPYSALRLRFALAVFGLLVCAAGGALVWTWGYHALAIVLYVFAVVAIVDMCVIIARFRRGG
jgi:hypothetical protein